MSDEESTEIRSIQAGTINTTAQINLIREVSRGKPNIERIKDALNQEPM